MSCLLPLLALALSSSALAQDTAALQVDSYRLDPGGHGLLSTGHAAVLPHGRAYATAWLAQTTRPLVAFSEDDPDERRALVNGRQTLAVAWSMGMLDRVEVGLSIPVVVHQVALLPDDLSSEASSMGPADATLHLRGLILDPQRRALGLVIEAPLSLPTGNHSAWMGLAGPAIEPRLLASRRQGGLDATMGLGVRLQPKAELYNLVDDDKLTWRAAADLLLPLSGGPLVGTSLGAELLGAIPLRPDERQPYHSTAEVIGGARLPMGPLDLTLALGAGVLDGVGSPDWRGLFAISAGRQRRLPDAALTDTLALGEALLAEEALVTVEAPPVEEEPVIEVIEIAPLDGDGDGVADAEDACPEQAGTGGAGCPDEGPRLTRDQIVVDERIHFATGKAELLSESHPVLVRVVGLIEDNPDLRVRVEGHADATGRDDLNQRLSEQRANAVRAFLVRAAQDPTAMDDRLTALGFGEARPVDTNATEAGRAANRRVEFHLLAPAPPPAYERPAGLAAAPADQ